MQSGGKREGGHAGAPIGMAKLVGALLLTIVVVVLLVVFIVWLVLQPHRPKYYLESVDISTLGIEAGSGVVNSRVAAVFSTRNPNKRIGIYYDEVNLKLLYGYEEIGWGSMEPFYQTHKNTTTLNGTLSAWDLRIPTDEATDLSREKSAGVLDDVHLILSARVRFKVGTWKSSHYDVKVKCRYLNIPPNGFSNLHSKKCDVHVS